MQPYFFPYIGYFQLIAAVDLFIVYDNIKYTKKGWINRNRMLPNGKDAMFSLPLKNDSDSLDVRDRELAADFNPDKLLNQIEGAYRRAPYFAADLPLVERSFGIRDATCSGSSTTRSPDSASTSASTTEITGSSEITIDHEPEESGQGPRTVRGGRREHLRQRRSAAGAVLKGRVPARGIELKFIGSKPFEYPQFGEPFVPGCRSST